MDRCLLLFMAVLLVQLACGLFLPEGLAPEAGSIDVIVRTSAAAIFGYLLSANFNRGAEAAPSNRTGDPAKGPGEHLPDAPLPPEGAKSRIGFSAEPAGEEMDKGTVEFLGSEKTAPNQTPGCLQILMATAIGLFCLAILLLVRTAAWWGVDIAGSDSATATLAQLRDFVSGSVGFLIGCPTCADTKPKPKP